MKRVFLLVVLLLSMAVYSPWSGYAQGTSTGVREETVTLKEELRLIAGVRQVIEHSSGPFEQKFEVLFRQPLDHQDLEAGDFDHRFYLCYRGKDKPVVFVTEGYRGSYAENPRFTNEIAERYDANIILVEHRYFQASTPERRDWDYLTVANSMGDLHRINRAMKTLFPGKWIATGISKGGQTAIMYAVYHPGDVDVYVPYVAPVCFGVEDGRHEPFIEKVCGTAADRKKIRTFQYGLLLSREEIQPLFEKFCGENNLKFRIPIEEVYDYCVLEYSFAFWQWGTPVDQIPEPGSDLQTQLDHLLKVAGPDYFSISEEPSFYVQAARELGYYGYDIRPFRRVLTIRNAQGYLHRIMVPEDAQHYRFSNRVHKDIYGYLRRNDPKMICINGEFDPWNAAALNGRLFKNKRNMLLMVDQGGSHRARISTLSDEQQAEVWSRLDAWLAE